MEEENYYYTDLLKAHKIFRDIEGRWRFYDAYMESRDPNAWLTSSSVPLKEGLLLFGFVQSWDPNFKGDLAKFLQIYEDIFEMIRAFKHETIVKIDFTTQVKNSIAIIFDRIARCPRQRRFESTDASKILHVLAPNLFVMWDDKIRRAIVGEGRNGRCYAFEFLPKMQELLCKFIDNYLIEKGGNVDFASERISSMANNYTLAKLIDEYNYVRYTKRKSLLEIRNIPL